MLKMPVNLDLHLFPKLSLLNVQTIACLQAFYSDEYSKTVKFFTEVMYACICTMCRSLTIATASSVIAPFLFDLWLCVQLVRMEFHAPCH